MIKKKVLVTGANGQLGKTIEELSANSLSKQDFVFMSKSELDITDLHSLKKLFSKYSFDYVINCAAYTNVEQAEKTPEIAFRVNALGVNNLSKLCDRYDIVLIHISTDYVFDGKKEEPYDIEDLPNPINEYGKSKLLGEQHIQKILNKYFIIRTSWLYSKKYGNNFYKVILKKAKTQEDLYVTDKEKGCPTNTVNISYFIYELITKKNNNFGIYHFSGKNEMTWYDFAKEILLENGLLDKINLVKADNYVTFAKRPKYSVLANNAV